MVTWLFKAIVIGWICRVTTLCWKLFIGMDLVLLSLLWCQVILPSIKTYLNFFDFSFSKLLKYLFPSCSMIRMKKNSDDRCSSRMKWNEVTENCQNFFFANDDCRRKSVGLTQKGHSFFTCCRFESWWLLPQCSLVAKLCNCCGSGGWAVNCWSQWPGFKSCSSRAP